MGAEGSVRLAMLYMLHIQSRFNELFLDASAATRLSRGLGYFTQTLVSDSEFGRDPCLLINKVSLRSVLTSKSEFPYIGCSLS